MCCLRQVFLAYIFLQQEISKIIMWNSVFILCAGWGLNLIALWVAFISFSFCACVQMICCYHVPYLRNLAFFDHWRFFVWWTGFFCHWQKLAEGLNAVRLQSNKSTDHTKLQYRDGTSQVRRFINICSKLYSVTSSGNLR